MDCLDFNLHQLILSDIAQNIGDAILRGESNVPLDVITSRVETRNIPDKSSQPQKDDTPRVFMSSSQVNCNIGFAELAVKLSKSHAESAVSVLLEMLRDVHYLDFDTSLSWNEWSLPDQLVFASVTALLQLATAYPSFRERVLKEVFSFVSQIVDDFNTCEAVMAISQIAPSFHGFYRAVTSTPFAWTVEEWEEFASRVALLFTSNVPEHFNELVIETLEPEDDQKSSLEGHFIQSFMSRYLAMGRPLTGYFMICCIMELHWVILSQALCAPGEDAKPKQNVNQMDLEAAAANNVWRKLTGSTAARAEGLSSDRRKALERTLYGSDRLFSELLQQLEDMESESSIDTYAWEAMAESLKLSTICCVAVNKLDTNLLMRITLLLSPKSPVAENLIQEAALKSLSVLIRNFPEIAPEMAGYLRRYVTAPLALFEYEFISEDRTPPPLIAAAKCLALSIELSPGEDVLLSSVYSLLNYIAATAQDSATGIRHPLNNPGLDDSEASQSILSGLQDWNEEQRRLIGISTIYVVTRLAMEFKVEEVTRLTISMLLQRLRTAEPTVESAITFNLVNLALIAPEPLVADILRALSALNKSVDREDPRYSNNTVVASQTRLAQDIHVRPDLYEMYLKELLELFCDKGMAVQALIASPQHAQIEQMVDQLAALILPIDALLSQKDFEPIQRSNTEFVTLFRNMWLLCILFGFNIPNDQQYSVNDWQRAALTRIAMKTPPFVIEHANDYVLSDLEYNSVIKHKYAITVISKHRAMLHKKIQSKAADVRHLPPAQVVFLLAVHCVETMRASAGLPSSLIWNFSNSALNSHNPLSGCLVALSEEIMRDSVDEMSRQVVDHVLPESTSRELQNLLVASCHRVEMLRKCASSYLHHLITSFPSLMCDPPLVNAILEVLTLLQQASAGEFTDEYNPQYEFHSERTLITLCLPDSFEIRNHLLGELLQHAKHWFEMALARAPLEFQATLQKYLSSHKSVSLPTQVALGASVALHFACAVPPGERKIVTNSRKAPFKTDRSKLFADSLASSEHFAGEADVLFGIQTGSDSSKSGLLDVVAELKAEFAKAVQGIRDKSSHLTIRNMKTLLFRCAAIIQKMPKRDSELLHNLIVLPFAIFTPSSISVGIQTWTWLIGERPELEFAIMTEIDAAWISTIRHGHGLYGSSLNYEDPFNAPVEYGPTDKDAMSKEHSSATRLLTPHSMVLQMLLSRFQAARYDRRSLIFLILRLIFRSATAFRKLSTHALAREPRFSFLLFGFEALKSSRLDSFCENRLRESLYGAALSWFAFPAQWQYGSSKLQSDADIKILIEFLLLLEHDSVRGSHTVSCFPSLRSETEIQGYRTRMKALNRLLKVLVENDLTRLTVWSNPSHDARRGLDYPNTVEKSTSSDTWKKLVEIAWDSDPAVAVGLINRFKAAIIEVEVVREIRRNPAKALHNSRAFELLLKNQRYSSRPTGLKYALLWDPLPPVMAIAMFQGPFKANPSVTQYAHRVLGQHPVQVTFFFVPQVVQALREDALGYVERLIFQTTRISQLFCHQIIWNMKANCYKDDLAEVEDPMKPALERVIDRIVTTLDGEAQAFYNREFTFFDTVTSISGKLKPFIKKTKPEKKAKIDEEMAKIVVDVGVYLPSNPEGVVVDIDKRSGRPLQSHAKAPFMATFKVRKESLVVNSDPDSVLGEEGEGEVVVTQKDFWQAAMFKVGDDCRQDVLALQVIAMFKNIFTSVGLPLYLFPYRVTATAPGSGVIDVVPNATSRDEMGRNKVNDLTGFFVTKYGGQDTMPFQQARMNFIQSMAAYSLACYILQIKDRHNGNIMIDGEGHVVHVDFGFLFDIDGVKFEPNSFKLTHEMITLMGGRDSQGYNIFQQLTIKGFLAIRPYADQIVTAVRLMLGTDFPSFKGEGTIRRLHERFALNLNERQAADLMASIIKNAYENMRSLVYDEFQRLQNGMQVVPIAHSPLMIIRDTIRIIDHCYCSGYMIKYLCMRLN